MPTHMDNSRGHHLSSLPSSKWSLLSRRLALHRANHLHLQHHAGLNTDFPLDGSSQNVPRHRPIPCCRSSGPRLRGSQGCCRREFDIDALESESVGLCQRVYCREGRGRPRHSHRCEYGPSDFVTVKLRSMNVSQYNPSSFEPFDQVLWDVVFTLPASRGASMRLLRLRDCRLAG